MLVFRILTTVFVGISFLTGIMKNIVLFNHDDSSPTDTKHTIMWSIWSILWRSFVIVSVWVI